MPSVLGVDPWDRLIDLSPPPHPHQLCILQGVSTCLQSLEGRLAHTEEELSRLLDALHLHKKFRFPRPPSDRPSPPSRWLNTSITSQETSGALLTFCPPSSPSPAPLQWLGLGLQHKVSTCRTWATIAQRLLHHIQPPPPQASIPLTAVRWGRQRTQQVEDRLTRTQLAILWVASRMED